MKRIISVIVCLVALCVCVSAFGASYTVSPLNITLSVPDSMYVFTRDTSPDDSRFSALGFGYDTMMETFKAQDIYLQAMSTNPGNQKEIVLICSPTEEKAYSGDITSLYNGAIAEKAALEGKGKTVIAEDIYESGGIDYVVVEYSDIFTCREYITIHSGMKIKIRLTDYEGEITSTEEEELEAVVKTVSLPEEKAPKVEEEKEEVVSEETKEEEKIAKETSKETSPITKETRDKLIRILIIIGISLLLITLPALIMRLFLFRKGLSRGASKAFAVIYSIALAALIYYLQSEKLLGDIPVYVAVIPLVWSFVIYKIVKH